MATPTTLPATFVSGAVLTAAQQNDLRGAFRVLQVVTGTTAVSRTSSSSTYQDTNLTATITPTSTSSKILVFVHHVSCEKSVANPLNRMAIQLHRNGSSILQLTAGVGYTASALVLHFSVSATYMDSPASVAALTYKTQFINQENVAAVIVQSGNIASTITLMEISA